MKFTLLRSRTFVGPRTPVQFRPHRIFKATGKGEGSKPSENGSKLPKLDLVTKDSPLHKDAKPVEEKKPPPIAKLPTPPPVEKKKHFINKQRFVVPTHLETIFKQEWTTREGFMQTASGFVGLKINTGMTISPGNKEVTVASEWESIPEWEAYSCSNGSRRSHLPSGIYQYVPKKGEGFPEDFVPFLEYKDPVNAKY